MGHGRRSDQASGSELGNPKIKELFRFPHGEPPRLAVDVFQGDASIGCRAQTHLPQPCRSPAREDQAIKEIQLSREDGGQPRGRPLARQASEDYVMAWESSKAVGGRREAEERMQVVGSMSSWVLGGDRCPDFAPCFALGVGGNIQVLSTALGYPESQRTGENRVTVTPP